MSLSAATPAPARLRRERGAVVPILALLLPVLLLATGFAVDLGRQRASRRTMQARADVVALDLVRLADGRDELDILTDPDYVAYRNGTLDRNNALDAFNAGDVDIEFGTWTEASGFIQTLDTGIPDAVEVTTRDEIEYYFQPGTGKTERSAIAVANDLKQAYFQVGSYLLAVNPSSNSLLNEILPGASVLSYNGLIGATLTLGELEAGLAAVSPGKALDSEISYQELVLASATALQAQGGNSAAVTLLNGMVATAPTVEEFSVLDVIGGDLAGGTPAGTAEFDVLGLLTGMALLSDGDHAVSLPATTVNIPGVGVVDASLSVIERPQIGGPNLFDTASTGQVQLTINPRIAVGTSTTINICSLSGAVQNALNNLVGGVLNLVTCLLGGVLNRVVTLDVTVDAPLNVVAAGALVTLTDIQCESGPGIELTPSPIPLSLTGAVTLTITGTLGGASLGNLAQIVIPAHAVSMGDTDPEFFDHPSEFGPPPRSTGSNPLGFANLLSTSAAQATLLNVPLAPVINPLLTPLTSTLNNTLGLVDSTVVGPLAKMAGVSLGGADLTALSMDCGLDSPKLVG